MILLAPALSELAKIGMNSNIPTALEILQIALMKMMLL